MKILNREAFLAMPGGTVYAKVDTPPTYGFGSIEIKGATLGGTDFCSQRLIGDFEGVKDSEQWFEAIDEMHAGGSRTLDFDIEGRDGLFDQAQRFAVYEGDDVEKLISRLQATLA